MIQFQCDIVLIYRAGPNLLRPWRATMLEDVPRLSEVESLVRRSLDYTKVLIKWPLEEFKEILDQ